MSIFVNFLDVVEVGIVVGLLMFFAYGKFKESRKQSKCNHDDFYENRACDAICKGCSKNLGFIGVQRERKIKQSIAAERKRVG